GRGRRADQRVVIQRQLASFRTLVSQSREEQLLQCRTAWFGGRESLQGLRHGSGVKLERASGIKGRYEQCSYFLKVVRLAHGDRGEPRYRVFRIMQRLEHRGGGRLYFVFGDGP